MSHIAGLVNRSNDAAGRLISGDVRGYLELIKHSDDYTLMAPSGGGTRHGFDASDATVKALEEYFTAGEAQVELTGSYASGDLVVLALIERQHGEVGGLPDQDWSLRVTVVFRRVGDDWQLVHRHADPLVRPISHEQAAQLARG
ncbi:nuclear transport factor 2 family protein [Kribbella sp. NBC_01505]|uniref:YybH family protein n=1 Tax=Kribbella sp. NBC_01505 TaxID=2903580 RepID=UPI00386382D4